MSTEEYQHKFAVQAIPGLEGPPIVFSEEAYSTIETAVKKSGFNGRYLVHFSELPDYIGFVLEMDEIPKPRVWKKLAIIEPKEINY